MEGWMNGRVEDWRSGGMEEWRNGGLEEWRRGGIQERRRGGVEDIGAQHSGIIGERGIRMKILEKEFETVGKCTLYTCTVYIVQ